MKNTVSVKNEAGKAPLANKAAELLKRGISERTGIEPSDTSGAQANIILKIADGIGKEGFRIEDAADQSISIIGNDPNGLIYGVGKFLRSLLQAEGSFTPLTWRGTSVPVNEVRGMYFATHFHNWYHEAPIEQIVRYVEDLALWGCNVLTVWFDMHHYGSIDEPDAKAMIQRLHAILEAAIRVGIRPSMLYLANEAFASSPQELRADMTPGHDGYIKNLGGYGVEVCPSKPKGLDLILKSREQVLDAFSDIDLAYVWLWPYDQGGCSCSNCAPWGANGYFKVCEPVAKLIKKRYPNAKIILSTWLFDRNIKGEWKAFHERIDSNRPDWVDYLLIDGCGSFPEYPLVSGVPGDFPVLNFPEISMHGMSPWGGFGANPQPRYWQAYWDKTRALVSGGFPYSEGIFEDINKVPMLQLNWNPAQKIDDILREYAASYFSPDIAEDFVKAAYMLEDDRGHRGLQPDGHYGLGSMPSAQAAFELITQMDGTLPNNVRHSWRWRIIWLRAALDAELKATEGKPTEQTDVYLRELIEIYYAQHPDIVGAVRPPAR